MSQRGEALLTVLLVIILIILIFSGLLLIDGLRLHWIHRDHDLAQARYNAESGLYTAIDSLRLYPRDFSRNYSMILPWGDHCEISIQPFGLFLKVMSTGYCHDRKLSLQAWIGEVPSAVFNNAILCADDRSALMLAGNAKINGRIITGHLGTQIRTFKGKRFSGYISGPTLAKATISLPIFQTTLLDNLVISCEHNLITLPTPFVYIRNSIIPDGLDTNKPVTLYSDQSIHLSTSTPKLQTPIIVVSKKSIILDGTYEYPAGSKFIAADSICVQGQVHGQFGLFFAEGIIRICNRAQCAGQFISRNGIIVANASKLLYPSVLCTISRDGDLERNGFITLNDTCYVEGTLINPPFSSLGIVDNSQIIVNEKATLNGLIFNSNQTQIMGTVEGAVVTMQFRFLESPTLYLNWVITGVIDYTKQRSDYLLPLLFDTQPEFDILQYEHIY